MSLVTRCSACGTSFKVVRDQLRISEGWVRCGRCSHVFDASLDLRETPDLPLPSVSPVGGPVIDQVTGPRRDALPALIEQVSPASPQGLVTSGAAPLMKGAFSEQIMPSYLVPLDWPARDLLDVEHSLRGSVPPVVDAQLPYYGLIADEPWPEQPPEPEPADEPERNESPVPPLKQVAAAGPSADMSFRAALQHARVRAEHTLQTRPAESGSDASPSVVAPTALAPKPVAELAPTLDVALMPMPMPELKSKPEPMVAPMPVRRDDTLPSFLRESGSAVRGWWWPRERAVHPRAWLLGLCVLALLLVAQLLRRDRDELAARQPMLRPVLAQLCSLTGCEVAALRQISAVVIDSTSLVLGKKADSYRLDFTLRNTATLPLATPAVELTLLDTHQRAVVRRVIRPSEFGAAPVLEARSELTASIGLSLDSAGAAALAPVAGHGLLAFYP